MRVRQSNHNNYISLSKRPKSNEKMKYNTIINNNPQNNSKYKSYINSPMKDDSMSLIKKKFHKLKKINNNNNKDSNSSISSSYINFMSPINNNYNCKKQNSSLAKFLKKNLIQNSNSFDNSSRKNYE